jgi:hypothetical protein
MSGFHLDAECEITKPLRIRHHLVKPFAPEELDEVLDELARLKAAEAPSNRRVQIPPLVPIVLRECVRRRGNGELSQETFEGKIARLEKEQLAARGWVLQWQELGGGVVEFVIRERQRGPELGTVRCGAVPLSDGLTAN